MRPVYAVQFEVRPTGTLQTAEIPGSIEEAAIEWVKAWYKERKKTTLEVPLQGANLVPFEFHRVLTDRQASDGQGQSWNLSWSYPDDRDDRLLWHSHCKVASLDDSTEFSLIIRLQSREFLISPHRTAIRQPRLVREVIKRFTCYLGGRPLTTLPTEVTASDIEKFVADVLTSKDRSLPTIIYSKDGEQALADPFGAAEKLAGLAEVFVMADRWASLALSDEIGRLFSCYNGAVRVYWPGFVPEERPFAPIFLPERLRLMRKGELTYLLLGDLAGISGMRFVPGPVTRKLNMLLAQKRAQEASDLRRKARESGDYRDLFELSEKENRELRGEVETLKLEKDDLTGKLSIANANLSAAWQSATVGGAAVALDSEEPSVPSVRKAVDMASEQFRDTLTFLRSAVDSADQSPYAQPEKVFRAFQAMDDVCLVRREAKRRREPMGLLEDAFKQRGFEYKAKESMTSTGKWSAEYQALYQGKKVSIEPHLALGKVGPETCLRIHFYMDDDSGRFVIAHVGRHKTNTKS